MKNLSFTILCFLFVLEHASAQIMLNLSGYPTTFSGADSVKATIGNTGFPSITPAINATWDFSGITYSAGNYLTQFIGVPSPETFGTPLTMGSGITSYQTVNFNKISSLGYTVDADSIGYQYTSLTPLTAGATDSFILPNQVNYYSSPNMVIKFPATIGNSWSSNYSYADNFILTVGVLSLSHAAGQFKYTFIESDSVVGWGQMRVKEIDGTTSGYMDVLQVKRTVTRIDSFFIGGSPASGVILTMLGVTQGQSHNYYQYRFYRANEVTPLAEVLYPNAGFTTPDSAFIHTQRLAIKTAVNIVSFDNEVKLYPNPVDGNMVSIDVPSIQNAHWSYELINISGQNIASDKLPLNSSQTHAAITFSRKPASGIYYISLINNNQVVSVKHIEIR